MSEQKRMLDLLPPEIRAQLTLEIAGDLLRAKNEEAAKEREPEKPTDAEINKVVDLIMPR